LQAKLGEKQESKIFNTFFKNLKGLPFPLVLFIKLIPLTQTKFCVIPLFPYRLTTACKASSPPQNL
jgi:hypothetical protein